MVVWLSTCGCCHVFQSVHACFSSLKNEQLERQACTGHSPLLGASFPLLQILLDILIGNHHLEG